MKSASKIMDKSDVNRNSKLNTASGISSYITPYKNNCFKKVIKPFQPIVNQYSSYSQDNTNQEYKKYPKKDP